MAKIEVRSRLVGDETDHQMTTSGILTTGKIVYREPEIRMVLKFANNHIQLERSHSDYTLKLSFENQHTCSGSYQIKEPMLSMEAKTKTKALQVEDGMIDIIYELILGGQSLGDYHYHLDYEVKE